MQKRDKADKEETASAISAAIRAKQTPRERFAADIQSLETAILAEIESFDLDAAFSEARREQIANATTGTAVRGPQFPEIVPEARAHQAAISKPVAIAEAHQPLTIAPVSSSLLDQLRQQAELQQQASRHAEAERSVVNEALDAALNYLFYYFHEFVQQLNILKPVIARDYPLIEDQLLKDLSWQTGFADFRTQSPSAGSLIELVLFNYRLHGQGLPPIRREAAGVERFRNRLFDAGLPFTCEEFRNDRRYVEHADFHIRSEISVSTRWRADFENGKIILEARNLERLGSTSFTLSPASIDQALLDEFGRLVLGQANHFRELAQRP